MKKMGLGLVLLTSSLAANAAMFTFSGNITEHNEVIRVDFTLTEDATNVRVWTDSFMATGPDQEGPGTNFDPITALWNTETGDLISENDDNDDINPDTQTYFDSGFSLPTLAAGNYFFTMATFDNFASGNNIADGFDFNGQAPIDIATWSQPANPGNLGGGFWRIRLDGVDNATGPMPQVPVPAAAWLFGTAIAGFGFGRRKTV